MVIVHNKNVYECNKVVNRYSIGSNLYMIVSAVKRDGPLYESESKGFHFNWDNKRKKWLRIN